jgi:hypothetical protein
MKRLATILTVLTVLLAGCRAEVRLLVDVTEEGTGTITAEVGIDQQLRDLIDRLAGDSERIISGLDLGLEGESETRVEGDLTIYSTVASFDEVASVPEASAGNLTSFTVDLTEDGASLEATLNLAGELDVSEFPVDPNAIGPENLQAEIIVSLPGEPVDHNADELLEDGRFSWVIPLDGELYMFANTEYPKSDFPLWLFGLLALTGVLAIGVWIAAVRRDRRSDTQRRPAPEPPPVAEEKKKRTAETDPESPFFDL